MVCYRTGGCGAYEMYPCSECPASKPSYLERGRKRTNEYAIRNLWPAQRLASALIGHRMEDDWGYGCDDEWYVCGSYDVYTTSDGEEFGDFDDAVDHELWWLAQEADYGD